MSAALPTVGVIGLGLVGCALSARLQSAGYPLVGHDHLAAARDAWLRAGAQRMLATPHQMGSRCSTVVLAVFDSAGVLQVLEGPGGVLQGCPRTSPRDQPAPAVIDCSTGDPDTLQVLGARLAAQGIDFIEAPLSGSSQQIAAGTATLLLGATPEALKRHSAVLTALASQQVHAGGPGMGARAKLATNLVLGLNRAALAEGLVFAENLGISNDAFLKLVLATPARSEAALVKGEQMVRGDFTPQSRIHQHLKDLQLMRAAASAAGQRLPFTDVHATLLQSAVEAGDGELDNAAIVRQLRRERC